MAGNSNNNNFKVNSLLTVNSVQTPYSLLLNAPNSSHDHPAVEWPPTPNCLRRHDFIVPIATTTSLCSTNQRAACCNGSIQIRQRSADHLGYFTVKPTIYLKRKHPRPVLKTFPFFSFLWFIEVFFLEKEGFFKYTKGTWTKIEWRHDNR